MKEKEIEKYLESKYPGEAAIICIGSDFFPLGDIGHSSNHIIIDYKDLSRKLDKAKDKDKITFIHSHIDISANASDVDFEVMELWPNVEWDIYSIYQGKVKDVKKFNRKTLE